MARKKGIPIKKDYEKKERLHVNLSPIHMRILNREIKRRGLHGKKGSQSYVIECGLEALSQTISIEEKMREDIRKDAIEHANLGQRIIYKQQQLEKFIEERKKREEAEETAIRENILKSKPITEMT